MRAKTECTPHPVFSPAPEPSVGREVVKLDPGRKKERWVEDLLVLFPSYSNLIGDFVCGFVV